MEMTTLEAIKFAEYAQIMADGKPDVQEFYRIAETALRAKKQLQEIVLEIERCDYECEAGPLSNNLAFMELKELADCVQQNAMPEAGRSPCTSCGYGGKHLEAPPCGDCPAYPKVAERNDPLTLDELRQMKGEPVWVQSPGIPEYGRWAIVEGVDITGADKILYLHDDFTCHEYGRVWLAYRHKPKEAPV